MSRHFVAANALINPLRIGIVSKRVVWVHHLWRILEKWAHLAAAILLNVALI